MSDLNVRNEQVTDDDGREFQLEEAFAQIEAVLKHMEQPDISLRESLAEYERGVALLKKCNDEIDRVEKQMIILRAGIDGPDAEAE